MSDFPKHMTFNAACGEYMIELRETIEQLREELSTYKNALEATGELPPQEKTNA
jgi:hypothetical protein